MLTGAPRASSRQKSIAPRPFSSGRISAAGKDRNIRSLIPLTGAVLFVAAGGIAAAGPLTVSGLVFADRQAALSSRIPARIAAVYVADNGPVRSGQTLIQLDDAEQRAQLNSSRAELGAARALQAKAITGRTAQQAKCRAEVISADNALSEAIHKRDAADLAFKSAAASNAAELKAANQAVQKAALANDKAKKTVSDLEQLDRIGGVSRNDLEDARRQASLAQADLDAANDAVMRLQDGPNGVPYRVALAQADLDAAADGVNQARAGVKTATEAASKALEVSNADVKSAAADVTRAQAGVAAATGAVNAMRIKSPLDGIATALNARAGETAQPGAALVTVVSLRNSRVEALVLARNIPSIHVGTHATVTIDTLPGRSLDAVVSDISWVAEPDQRSVRVKFRLLTHIALRPGLGARISIR